MCHGDSHIENTFLNDNVQSKNTSTVYFLQNHSKISDGLVSNHTPEKPRISVKLVYILKID